MADKAFLCGINEYTTLSKLRGCVRDTKAINDLLTKSFGFKKSNIRIKTDEDVTKKNLESGWKWLLRNAQPGDRLVFHFSGHGSYVPDMDIETGEADFRDEILCLWDMDWNNPATYLLDDELARWTEQIPTGVHVTFVLDCCFSGTGTRMVKPPSTRSGKGNPESLSAHSLEAVAAKRANKSGTRGKPKDLRPEQQSDIGQNTVLARFAQPPIEVERAIAKAKKSRSFRSMLNAAHSRSAQANSNKMNHVLWAGCRDDQTAADAFLDGDYHGAFTYHLIKAVGKDVKAASSQNIIQKVRKGMKADNFDQVPQLEPSATDAIILSGTGDAPIPVDSIEDTSDHRSIQPSQDQWGQLLNIMQSIADHLGVNQSVASGARNDTAPPTGRSIAYIHGICKHESGFSDPWFDAMSPHLDTATATQLQTNRHEVLWSKHVTRMDRSLDLEIDPIESEQLQTLLHEILEERMVREASEQIAEQGSNDIQSRGGIPRAAFGVPGLNCVDDFVKYLSSGTIRKKVIGEATAVLRPLLIRGDRVELISHSWGTVVAYEALHTLGREGLSGRVHNWFTVGSALAIGFVAKRLRPHGGRKPGNVDCWINLDAKGDGVGGSIRATGMHVDQEYLRLEPFGCDSFLGLVSPACAHSSYFKTGNDAVNRDIFARLIEQA